MGVLFADVAGIDWYAEDASPPLTVLKPAAFGPGQLLIAVITQQGTFADLTAPSGWTSAGNYNGDTQGQIWYHVYAGGEPSTWDFGYSVGGDAALAMIRITNADLTPHIAATTTALFPGTSSEDSPTVTPTGLNDLLLCVLTNMGNSNFFAATDPSTMTNLGRIQYLDQFMGLYLDREYLTNGNATGVRTWTSVSPTGVNAAGGALSIAVKSSGVVDPDPPPNPPPPIVPPHLLREILAGRRSRLVPDVSLTPQIRELWTGAASASSVTLTTSGNVAAGDTLVVLHGNDFYTAAQMLTPTGTAGTWTQQAVGDNGASSAHQKVWTRPVTVGGAQTVTCAPAIDEEHTVHLYVIIGADPTTPVDVAAGGNGATSGSHICPSVTPTSTRPLLLFGVQATASLTYVAPQFVQAWNTARPPVVDATAFTASQVATGGATGTRTMTAVSGATPYASVTVAIQAPLSAGTPATVTPSTVAAVAAITAPGVSAGAGVTAATVSAVATIATPTVTVAGNATVTPATIAATAAIGGPTIQAGAATTGTTVAATATVPAPTVQAGAGAAPATVAAVAAIGAPVGAAGSMVTPATVAAIAAIGTPTVQAGARAVPSTVAAVASVGAVTVQAGAVVTPGTVAATASIPTPSLGGSVVANPATVAAIAAIGTATVQAGATVAAATVAAIAAVATPAVSAGARTTPATVAAIAAIGTPTVRLSAAVAPATVAAVSTVPAVTIRAGAAPAPATVAATAVIGTPAISGGGSVLVFAATVSAVATVGSAAVVIGRAVTYRPFTGTTVRPGTGTTVRPGTGTTARPGSGITVRPFTSVTPRP